MERVVCVQAARSSSIYLVDSSGCLVMDFSPASEVAFLYRQVKCLFTSPEKVLCWHKTIKRRVAYPNRHICCTRGTFKGPHSITPEKRNRYMLPVAHCDFMQQKLSRLHCAWSHTCIISEEPAQASQCDGGIERVRRRSVLICFGNLHLAISCLACFANSPSSLKFASSSVLFLNYTISTGLHSLSAITRKKIYIFGV